MTAVVFQLKKTRAEILADSLVVRGTSPSAWACKCSILPAAQLALVTRGPDDFRHSSYRRLDHTHLPDGIDSAIVLLPAILGEVHEDLANRFPDHAQLLEGHAYVIGFSRERKAFTAWRFLPPTFTADQLPEGLHAAPGPGTPTFHTPGFHPLKKMLQVLELQKQAVRETWGYDTIGGDVWNITMLPNGNIQIGKCHRFKDADAMNAEMDHVQEETTHLD